VSFYLGLLLVTSEIVGDDSYGDHAETPDNRGGRIQRFYSRKRVGEMVVVRGLNGISLLFRGSKVTGSNGDSSTGDLPPHPLLKSLLNLVLQHIFNFGMRRDTIHVPTQLGIYSVETISCEGRCEP
jgi:hypothetical protein